jgi:hypothetical protein
VSRAPSSRKAPAKPARRPGGAGIETHAVGSSLRARLHQVEVGIGMLAEPDAVGAGDRFRGAKLLPADSAVPAAFRALFPDDLGELGRLGKSATRCHAAALGAYRVFCLPYFTFDGFNALLAVEEGGEFLAAWKDLEAHQALYPREIHVRGPASALERFLARAGRPAA